MGKISSALIDLKARLRSGQCAVAEAQREAAGILLSDFYLKDAEFLSREIDNEFERIIFTLPEDMQTEAAIGVLELAIRRFSERKTTT
jgi:hypothetical protein